MAGGAELCEFFGEQTLICEINRLGWALKRTTKTRNNCIFWNGMTALQDTQRNLRDI
jgi:hypothetical protein